MRHLAAVAAYSVANAMLLRPLASYEGAAWAGETPLVSVLVPARNEAANLPRLLESLARQDHARLEVLVLDDHSTDDTSAIAEGFAARDARFRLIRGRDLPPGWLGKPHACAQLAEQARGDILVFTDADTAWADDAVSLVVRALAATGAGALSAWPSQEIGNALAALLQPFQQVSVVAFLPAVLVPYPAFPSAVAANGQAMAFTRRAYVACGGHAVARASVIEDMHLGRAVKHAGYRLALVPAGDRVRCRMYRSDAEAWEGFAKNIYAGVGASPAALAATLLLANGLFLLPWLQLAEGALRRRPLARPLAGALLSLVPRLASDLRFGFPQGLAPLNPVGALAWSAAAVESALRYSRGQVSWKGRAYDLRPGNGARA